jgi:hypothetical protein
VARVSRLIGKFDITANWRGWQANPVLPGIPASGQAAPPGLVFSSKLPICGKAPA